MVDTIGILAAWILIIGGATLIAFQILLDYFGGEETEETESVKQFTDLIQAPIPVEKKRIRTNGHKVHLIGVERNKTDCGWDIGDARLTMIWTDPNPPTDHIRVICTKCKQLHLDKMQRLHWQKEWEAETQNDWRN